MAFDVKLNFERQPRRIEAENWKVESGFVVFYNARLGQADSQIFGTKAEYVEWIERSK